MNDRTVPVFCRWPVLFAALTIAELGALLPLLDPLRPWSFATFGLASLFAVWMALIALAVLCLLGHLLERLGRSGWLLAWLLVIAVALAMGTVTTWFDRTLQWQMTGTAPAVQVIVRIGLIAALLGGALLRYLVLDERWRHGRLAAERARFDALQARIRPHFLFNALNTVAALIPERPRDATATLEQLAALLRGALGDPDRLVPLSEELQLCRDYLALQQLRFGARLEVHWALPDRLPEIPVPPLTLQPLVENAVLHGIAPLPAGGTIAIRAEIADRRIEFEIDNPVAVGHNHGRVSGLPGSDDRSGNTQAPTAAAQAAGHSGGLALANLGARLALHFGPEAQLMARAEADRFIVRLRLPVAATTGEGTA